MCSCCVKLQRKLYKPLTTTLSEAFKALQCSAFQRFQRKFDRQLPTQHEEELQVLTGKMPCFGLLDTCKLSGIHSYPALYSCRKWATFSYDTEEINRPTKPIAIPSLRLQKQLPENPFLHMQRPILLTTLLMITFHWLAKVPTLLSVLLVFMEQKDSKCFKINCLLSLQSKSAIKTVVMHQHVWEVGQLSRYSISLHGQLHPNARIRRTLWCFWRWFSDNAAKGTLTVSHLWAFS